jgi:hypothetical protein
VNDLLEDMQQCRSVRACIELALTDAYGPEEQATSWLTCIEAMFGRFKEVKLLGHPVTLVGFDLDGETVIALCRQGKQKARVTMDSIEFPGLTPIEARWLKAWQHFAKSQ